MRASACQVTDLNCSSVEVKVGARYRILQLHDPLPLRVIKGDASKAMHDPASAHAKTLPADVEEWRKARGAHGVCLCLSLSLGLCLSVSLSVCVRACVQR